ncbi:hypothetical protein [Lacisediminihabitans profunda]|uniref:Uncharacterized protein n=1 Tax=Lacisediminihabitans profunda TaxID=2594790 RepID=A0A5C8USD2_9MICO|nr:hypothetical protein [Lacisediminihabitans profunda]TXN30415.1 hypothetical protein FVP33_10500 [Lacisediminihabitans profunda]
MLAAGLAALSGCATTAAGPSPAPTVTATVTASPVPRSPNDSLTSLDAWLACSAAERANYGLQNPGTVFAPYDASNVKAESDGSFTVQVSFQPPGGTAQNPVYGAIASCVVKGTVSEPDIVSIGETDLG